MILLLLIVTATFRPAVPTVGDPITVRFEEPVTLDPSEAYEVVSRNGNEVVIRTFRPEPFELAGVVGNVRFRKLMVPVGSVLAADDRGEPAPLKPPAEPVRSRRPLQAIVSATVAALALWTAVILMARRRTHVTESVPEIPAAERFRLAVETLQRDPRQSDRWALLADATRRYLAAIEPGLGLELTTSEFLRATRNTNLPVQDVIAVILRQGDLEKFSPWGATATDFETTSTRALDLIPKPPVEVAA